MILLRHIKILPLLLIVTALVFGVRFNDFVERLSEKELPGTNFAQAQQDEQAGSNIGNNEDKPPAIPASPGVGTTAASLPDKPDMSNAQNDIDWRDASEEDLQVSTMRMELFEDLKERRRQLEQKERELSVREALLKTAEKEIQQKYSELVAIRGEIEALLQQQSDEERERIASLVKIYEGMKPKDAARIFNTLDMDILLQVVSEMSERKSAPIIASMVPERARALTTMLMDQKSLPALPDNL